MLQGSLILAKSFVFHAVICILEKQARTVFSLAATALGTGGLRVERKLSERQHRSPTPKTETLSHSPVSSLAPYLT